MKGSSTQWGFARVAAVLAVCGISFLMGVLLFGQAPDFQGEERQKLEARIDDYRIHRMEDDWAALYPMTDPEERKKVDIRTFLNFYGHGVLRMHDIELKSLAIDPVAKKAVSVLSVAGELVPARLPESVRRGFNEQHAEHLQQTVDHVMHWVWRDGQWYYGMDQELLSRRDLRGNEVVIPSPKGNS